MGGKVNGIDEQVGGVGGGGGWVERRLDIRERRQGWLRHEEVRGRPSVSYAEAEWEFFSPNSSL